MFSRLVDSGPHCGIFRSGRGRRDGVRHGETSPGERHTGSAQRSQGTADAESRLQRAEKDEEEGRILTANVVLCFFPSWLGGLEKN